MELKLRTDICDCCWDLVTTYHHEHGNVCKKCLVKLAILDLKEGDKNG